MAEETKKKEAPAEPEAVEEEAEIAAQPEESGRGLRYQKTNAVCRRCRRLETKLFLKGERCFGPKCPFVRRKYPPGDHGQIPRRLSDYGQQLQAKQVAAAVYGLKDRELRRIFRYASKTPSSTKEIFAQRLERRLDNVLYQAGLALSRRQARQMIGHGQIKINKEKIKAPSYLVNKGEKISVSEQMIKGNLADAFKRIQAEKEVPSWLKREKSSQATVKNLPEKIADKLGFDIQLIIEYYSR